VAFIENEGVKLYWDQAGQGPPLLLIMGLAYPSQMWHRTRPLLAERYRTIAFDNRGSGRSDVPQGPYSIEAMASDAAAVLDAADVRSAHVYGVSMGGMIAQEFALQYPDRVRSLILGSTTAGVPNSVRASPEVTRRLLEREQSTPNEAAEAAIPFIYDPGTSRERIDEDLAVRKDWPPRSDAYINQLMGVFAWDSHGRLERIAAPTLVLHGANDHLVPPSNAEFIAARIPNAKLVMIPNASHIYSTDQPEAAHGALLEFLDSIR
jgi:pimeloyl-ACP methyl ester carboxylesterase